MNKYTKQRQIGEGAFGKAILVRRKADNQQFVIKEINIMKMSPKERQESKKEVAVLAQLNHPNIVRYRESFEETGSLYIVMDFCEKGDLYAKINNQRGVLFPEEQVMDWFVQICLAIKHIHDRKILHRDIKSQNIFLTSAGMVQLGDFGIAKVLGSTAELARTCIGTPYYLSPEIVENRPYNNKSDVWSLGCVLYELTTLKHAFEAGNMKNLVLKIIRGSYPPISPRYSYDLRGLISAMFKRSPRDRPSVNSILRKNFIQKRVTKFLTNEQMAEEFSHTVMHGQKISRALPPPPPASRPPAPAVHKATPARPPRYNPANVYGAPLRKSKDNRSSGEKKRPGSAGQARPGSAQPRPGSAQSRPGSARPGSAQGMKPSNSQDLKKKKEALILKEKKRQEEERRIAMERKHKELLEKQKLARMNKAREEGWKNLMGSLGSDDGDKKSPRDEIHWPQPKPDVQAAVPGNGGDRGKYDQYHSYLDKLEQQRNNRLREAGAPKPVNPAAYMAAPRIANPPQPIPNWNRPGHKVPAPTPVYQPPQHGNGMGGKGVSQAEERARIVEDFIQRKKEAAINRQRGNADIFGNVHATPSPDVQPSANKKPPDGRNKEEQDYLEKLRQIRQQNLQERKIVQQKQNNMEGAEKARRDAEMRKKKIEALRKQAEDRANHLRLKLDRDRKEMFDKEVRKKEEEQRKYAGNRPGVPKPRPLPPKPAIGMTGALNAIGVDPPPPPVAAPAIGITGALGAIGAVSAVSASQEDTENKTKEQQQKEEILKRVNEKMAKRPKWAAPEKPECAEQSRPQWGGKAELKFTNIPMEATASEMEVTSARDEVIKLGTLSQQKEVEPEEPVSSRRQWGRPGSTVMRVLQEAPVEGAEESKENENAASPLPTQPEKPSPTPTGKPSLAHGPIPGIGSTITISPKPQLQGGTIVIKKEDQKDEETINHKTAEILSKETSDQHSEESNNELTDNSNPESQVENKPESEPSEPLVNVDNNSKTSASAKPPLPSKPMVLPKPVLLPKPDSPMVFGKNENVPTSVKSLGAGELFQKSEANTESSETKEKDMQISKTIGHKKEGEKPSSGVILGLTAGQFDFKNIELLRTCSEPDLSKLAHTAEKQALKGTVKRSLDLEDLRQEEDAMVQCLLENVELEEEECCEDIKKDLEEKAENNEEVGDNCEEEESSDVEDYEELLSVRETMQSLLLQESSTDEDAKESIKFRLSGSSEVNVLESPKKDAEVSGDGDVSTRDSKEGEENKKDQGNDEDGDDDDDDDVSNNKENKTEEEDDETKDDDNTNIDDDVDGNEDDNLDELENNEEDDNIDGSLDEENQTDPVSEDLFQSDESDADTQFGDDEDNFDLFSRLEESRAELETELGCDKFLKVYKTVQALQEDEDENIEEGAKLVTGILGREKEHLYPKIFQLVMADAAFTEENNSDKDDNNCRTSPL